MTELQTSRRWPWRLYALLLGLFGLVIATPGAYLVLLGGSPYYLLAGLSAAGSGVLLWRGSALARSAYALMLALTLVWALWEVGFDLWALLPRIVGPAGLGLGFLFGPSSPNGRPAWRTAGLAAIAVAVSIGAGAGAHMLAQLEDPDPLFQAGVTRSVPGVQRLPQTADFGPVGEWRSYGNDVGGSRFSPLDQLTPGNVGKLQKIWETHVGKPPYGLANSIETTPLKIGNALYLCTGYNDVLSLDAETGRVNWRFKAKIDMRGRPHGTCRGVAFYELRDETGACARRIITNTTDARLIALDIDTGAPCPGFGTNGATDLNVGMANPDAGYYYVSSAPTIVNGKIVLGGWVSDGQYWGEPSGVIRAYDAITGKFAWAFDVGRPDDRSEPKAGASYTPSTPNSWAPMSADPALGLVYVPTGNSSPDYYGAQRRSFDDRYSSSVVALDIATGNVRWTFQTVRHDLWDYDVASQPTLVDIPTAGGIRKALVQPTKRGEIFLLDRMTGKPIATVEDRAVPTRGAAPGERISPTQPFSVGMPSFSGPRWRERDMWGVTALDQLWCRIQFRSARYDGTMTPPGLTPSIAYPGFLGGIDWGSASVDKDRSLLIVNSNRVGNYDQLIPREEASKLGVKPSSKGSPRAINGIVAQANTPYAAQIKPFLSPLGVPCNRPPYGLISAIDLRTHKLLWSRSFGTAEDSGPLGLRSRLPLPMGLPNAGGSVATRGGLVFIGATQSPVLRAIDVTTGRDVWRTRLPAGGQATPMTYWSDASRRQFVVIAAGGNFGLRSPLGDSIVAYALPRQP